MAALGDSTTSYKFTHIIAIDFGTSGCGIAVWNVAAPSIENIHLFSNWFKKSIGTSYKCPTILLLDHEENVEAFGLDAIEKYYSKRVAHSNKINDYFLFTRFKTDLYNKVRASLCSCIWPCALTYCVSDVLLLLCCTCLPARVHAQHVCILYMIMCDTYST